MLFRSLRIRLTLWYALALAVILTASAIFWYLHFDRHLLEQVAMAPSTLGSALQKLRYAFWLYVPLVTFLIAVTGWFLARCALKPVDRITQAARGISAENLYQRLPVPTCNDEMAQLAETFNSMLARLEDSFQKIRQFSGDASHELRTPLTILKGETEVALRWAKDPEEYRHVLASNLEEIDRMGRIIEDLLVLSKSEAGEAPLALEIFNLSDLLQDLYLQGKTLADPKEIALSIDWDVTAEVRLCGDQWRLRQMFVNLITNAIRYTPDGGEVVIGLSVKGEDVVVSITDTGIGIAAEHLPHIFDRFYRTDEARNREDGGTGLGLAIVKWIVAAHAGRIEVVSTPGQGSAFTVHLPLHGPPAAADKAAPALRS